jgi:hypothetical protein
MIIFSNLKILEKFQIVSLYDKESHHYIEIKNKKKTKEKKNLIYSITK